MKNSKLRRALLLVASAVLLVCVSVGATLAYLTDDTEVVTNTFTVGSVTIDLDEAKATLYGEADGTSRVKSNEYKLIPGHTYLKDPTVHVTAGSEKCYVFVEVINEIEAIETTDSTKTIKAQMEAKDWKNIGGNLWVKKAIVDASSTKQDLVVFDNFTINGEVEYDVIDDYAKLTDANGTVTQQSKSINIKAYAVQVDGFADNNAVYVEDEAKAAWNATFGKPTTPDAGETT